MKVIALDFDDVIFDLNGTFRPWHNKIFGTNVQAEDINDYTLHKIYGANQQVINERFYRFYETAEHAEAPEIAGAREAIARLQEHYSLHIVTSRYELYKEVTNNWLNLHFPNTFTQVHFTNSFATGETNRQRSKSEVCKEIEALLLIDDAAHHVVEVTNQGISALLLEKTWNQNHDVTPAIRVNDWNHALSHLKQASLLP